MASSDQDRPDSETQQDAEALQSAPAQDADDQKKIDYTLRRWRVQREHYLGLYKLWSRAILFLLGKHYLEWNLQSRRWTPEQNVPRWRQRPVTNLVFAVYRQAIAKLTKQRPTFDVVPPRTGDSEDREAAALGNGLLQQLWREMKTPKLLMKVVGWLLSTGNISVLTRWDPERGKPVPLTVPVQVPNAEGGMDVQDCACDENGEPKMTTDAQGNSVPDLEAEPDQVLEGDIGDELISPINIRYNPDCKNKEDATEVYIGYLMPKATARKKWKLKDDDEEQDDEQKLKAVTDDELEEIDDLIANAAGAQEILGHAIIAGDRHESIGPRVLVVEYYGAPCNDYLEGRHWVVAGGMLAVPEEPLPEGFWPPTVDFDDVPVPGDPHAMGVIGQVLGLNREYNAKNGKIAEHDVLMAMGGKWVVHPWDKDLKITSDPGQKLPSKGYLEGKAPVQMKLNSLPEGVYKERDRILADLKLVSGVGDIGLAQKPEGVSSGRGFLVLQEQTDAVLAPTLFNIENALQELGRRHLVLARRHYREERILKIRGHNGRWEIRSFMGADLGDSIDVQVQIGSMFPWSRSARQDIALSTIQAMPGLVTSADGTVDHMKVARMLDVGGLQAFEPEADVDLQEVELEHAMFEEYSPAKGILTVPQLGFWQNHPAHYDGHTRILKADRHRFERWDPESQRLFIEHVLGTRQVIQTAAAGAAAPVVPSTEPPTDGKGPPQNGAQNGGQPARIVGAAQAAPGGGPSARGGTPPQLVRSDLMAAGVQ